VEALIEQQPVDDEALALRALIDAKSGHLQPSLAQLDAALQMLPTSRTLRVVRARLQSARNDPGAVAALLGEMTAKELGPAPAPPSRLRGDADLEDGQPAALPRERWPGRLAQLRQALEVELRQQNWAAAQRIVESARRTYPGTAFAAWLAGIVELARGNADQAEEHLHEALAAAPRSPRILVGLAKTWSRKKGAAFAADQLVQMAERDPAFGFARYLAARAYMDAHNPAQAEATLKLGLKLQPASSLPYLHLARHYLDLELTSEALATCRQGLSRFPHDLELRMMLAQVSADMGNAGEAIRIYEETLLARPDLDLIVYRRAMLLASQDDDPEMWARSMQMARPLQSDRPSDPVLLDTLGWVHLRAGDGRRAHDLLEAAVRGAPDNPTMRFHLATLYAREKKMDMARHQLKTALESSSYFRQRVEALRLLREIGG
jgi:predicted Zn-dependent protease